MTAAADNRRPNPRHNGKPARQRPSSQPRPPLTHTYTEPRTPLTHGHQTETRPRARLNRTTSPATAHPHQAPSGQGGNHPARWHQRASGREPSRDRRSSDRPNREVGIRPHRDGQRWPIPNVLTGEQPNATTVTTEATGPSAADEIRTGPAGKVWRQARSAMADSQHPGEVHHTERPSPTDEGRTSPAGKAGARHPRQWPIPNTPTRSTTPNDHHRRANAGQARPEKLESDTLGNGRSPTPRRGPPQQTSHPTTTRRPSRLSNPSVVRSRTVSGGRRPGRVRGGCRGRRGRRVPGGTVGSGSRSAPAGAASSRG